VKLFGEGSSGGILVEQRESDHAYLLFGGISDSRVSESSLYQ
jgi:hypothetical protein